MKRLGSSRLRLGLILLATIPALLIMGLVLLATTLSRFQEANQQFDYSADKVTQQVASSVGLALKQNQPQQLDAMLTSLLDEPGVTAIRILDGHHKVWLSYGSFPTDKPDLVKPRQLRLFERSPAALLKREPVLQGGAAPRVIGFVEIVFDPSGLSQREIGTLIQVIIIGLSALMIVAVIAWLIADRLSSRIDRLLSDGHQQRHIRRDQVRERELRWHQQAHLEQLWSSWSHDVRTPLHGVTGMLELLATTTLNPEQAHYLEQARAAADAMVDSLGQIERTPSELALGHDAQTAQDEPLSYSKQAWNRKRVLLIDTDPISQLLTRSIMEPWGVILTACATADLALRQRAAPCDLILVSDELVDMDAASFAEAWAAEGVSISDLHDADEDRPRLSNPALVLMTQSSDPLRHEHYRQVGLEPVLVKPLRCQQVLTLLTPLIAR